MYCGGKGLSVLEEAESYLENQMVGQVEDFALAKVLLPKQYGFRACDTLSLQRLWYTAPRTLSRLHT